MAQRRLDTGQFDFGRQVLGWTRDVYKKRDDVFKEAFLMLADEMQELCPKDTHFLMASLVASKAGMPRMTRPNPRPNAGPGTFRWDRAAIVGVVQSAQYGDKLYLGYTAEYAGFVHDGHGNVGPRPWVTLVTQRWKSIVQEAGKRIRDRA